MNGMTIEHRATRLKRSWRLAVAATAWMTLAAPMGTAQGSAAQPAAGAQAAAVQSKLPEFEVATINPAGPKDNVRGLFTYPGGRIVCSLCTVQYLMMEAFDIRDWQITGGPNWAKDAEYQIEAKPPETSLAIHLNNTDEKTAPSAEQRQMLQSLLMERFQLTIHRETRQGAVYLLERGKKTLQLRTPADPNEFHWAGGVEGMEINRGTGIAGRNISMPELAARLSRYLRRPVVDRTGLAGNYDFEFRSGDEDANADIPSAILSSIEGIGLKLSTGKGPVQTIVIDHMERPSEN